MSSFLKNIIRHIIPAEGNVPPESYWQTVLGATAYSDEAVAQLSKGRAHDVFFPTPVPRVIEGQAVDVVNGRANPPVSIAQIPDSEDRQLAYFDFWGSPHTLSQVLPRLFELTFQQHLRPLPAGDEPTSLLWILENVIKPHVATLTARDKESALFVTPAEQQGRGRFYQGAIYDDLAGILERAALPARPPELDPNGIDTRMVSALRYFDVGLGTAVYVHQQGEVLPTDQAIVIFLPGTAGLQSTGVSMIDAMNTLAKAKGKGRIIAPIAVDLPFHNFGPHDPDFFLQPADTLMTWIGAVVDKYSGYGKPIFLFGRSGGANYALEYAYRGGTGIAGVIVMSPSDTSPEWCQHYHDWRKYSGVPAYPPGYFFDTLVEGALSVSDPTRNGQDNWQLWRGHLRGLGIDDATYEMVSATRELKRPGPPGLLLVGAQDFGQSVPPNALEWYTALAGSLGLEMQVFPDGQHNVLAGHEATRTAARNAVHEFLAAVLNGDKRGHHPTASAELAGGLLTGTGNTVSVTTPLITLNAANDSLGVETMLGGGSGDIALRTLERGISMESLSALPEGRVRGEIRDMPKVERVRTAIDRARLTAERVDKL